MALRDYFFFVAFFTGLAAAGLAATTGLAAAFAVGLAAAAFFGAGAFFLSPKMAS